MMVKVTFLIDMLKLFIPTRMAFRFSPCLICVGD